MKCLADIALQKPSAQSGKISTHELDQAKNRLDGAFRERNLAVRRVVMPRHPSKLSKLAPFRPSATDRQFAFHPPICGS